MMANPKVSIIIRAKNEARTIGEVLNAVFAQDFEDFEAIVVDSGSTDGTLDIVERYPVELVTIPPEAFTFGYALNVGTGKARGEFAAYLSADAQPADTRWLRSLLSPFADPRVGGVYGRQVAYPGHNPVEEWRLGKLYGTERRVQGEDPFFSNANSCIRSRIWRQVPFDESLAGTEDQIWARAVQRQGFRIVYEPEAVVYHSHNSGLRGLYHRRWREAEGARLANGGQWWLASRLLRPPVLGWIDVLAFMVRRGYGYKWCFYALAALATEWWARLVGSSGFRTRRGQTSPKSAGPAATAGRLLPARGPEAMAGGRATSGEAGQAPRLEVD